MEKFEQVKGGLGDVELTRKDLLQFETLVPQCALRANTHNFNAWAWIEAGNIINLNGRRHRRSIPITGTRGVTINIHLFVRMIRTIEAKRTKNSQRWEDVLTR